MSRPSPAAAHRRSLPLLLILSGWLAGGPLHAQDPHAHGHHEGEHGELLGTVSFPTSCAPEVQADFDRAVAMLHSFWFPEAEATFRAVAEADPGCGMAHWGVAMTLWGNPMARIPPTPQRVTAALEALQAAQGLQEGMAEQERAWLRAAEVLFEGETQAPAHLRRMEAHEEVLRGMLERHPGDPEVAFFYGRIAVANAPPDDLTFSRQLHAARVMEPFLEKHADHPGLVHYLIHAYDAPPMAEHGLEAALRYAEIAPAAPHALHMPSHIFTRLGYWEESIETNARSAQAEPVPDAAVHPLDYMVYAHLQLGQEDAAGAVVARARNIPDTFYGGLIGYNFAAMQARYALERNRWSEAADLPVPEGAPTYVEGVTRFARALGAARSGDAARAQVDLEALAELRDRTRAEGDDYWATVLEAQELAAGAWAARARGEDDAALRMAREGARLESTVEKHPVTPGPLLPAMELLGDLLMELDRPGEALEAYEAVLVQERNRARALYGAARAAEATGNDEAAGQHYTALLELLRNADPGRADLLAAQAWQARR
jgi:hypothetical protein